MLPRAWWLAVTCSCHGVGRGGAASIYSDLIEAAVLVQISTYLFGTFWRQRWFAEGGCAWVAPPPTPQAVHAFPLWRKPWSKVPGLSSVKKPSVPRNTAPTTRPCHSCRKLQVTWNAGALSLVVELHDK